MSTLPLALPSTQRATAHRLKLPTTVGFFFSFRLFIMLLAVRVFSLDPAIGTSLTLLLNYVLFAAVAFYAFGPAASTPGSNLQSNSFRWVLVFFAFTLCSFLWTSTASLPAAGAFWLAMAADTAMLLLLLRSEDSLEVTASLFRGYIYGAVVIAVIAWLLPAQSDLRLGDEELLGPNQIGYVCAFAAFLAQYLISSGHRTMRYAAIFLSITLLRTFSKTTLAAFLVAEAYMLFSDHSMARKTKLAILILTALVLAAFSGVISSYFTLYANTGNSPETLTGRLGIWTYFLTEGAQTPWLGHGFHSVWNVVPLFGHFQARHAHNELIEQFYVYGVCGIVMLLGLYSSFFRQMRRLAASPLKTLGISFVLFAIVRGFADTEAFDLSLPVWLISLLSITALRTNSLSELPA